LREGWDSPNVFQICSSQSTTRNLKKRQEIGSAACVLAINQQGDRVRDEPVNVLTVIANESYEGYVAKYQSELETEFGADHLASQPANARKKGIANYAKASNSSPNSKNFGIGIKPRRRYNVTIDKPKLVADVVKELNQEIIRPPQSDGPPRKIGSRR